MKRSPNIVSRIPSRTQKAVQDTVAGCRNSAAADVARAALMDTVNGRGRFETSAKAWATRADMIQRLSDGASVRRAVARAERDEGEVVQSDPGPHVGASS